jgi:hypothetical protein
VLRIATDTVRKWAKATPGPAIISVSQNDCLDYCECAQCAALAKQEGSQAGPLLHFVNAIADAIKDEFPERTLDTLAYVYTRKPPAHLRPRPNVIVRLCSIECCFAHPLGSDPFNASFREDLRGWSKVAGRLWVWDYVVNFHHSIMPFPNLYVIKPNISLFIENGVTGIYEQAGNINRGGELAELRAYLIAKTLWDPSYDTDRAIGEFLAGYYGAAAPALRAYLDLIHAPARQRPGVHMGIYDAPNSGYLTLDMMTRAETLFDQAEQQVAGDPLLLGRVQVARLPVIYTEVMLGGKDLPNRAARLDQFERVAHAADITRVGGRSSDGLAGWLAAMRK